VDREARLLCLLRALFGEAEEVLDHGLERAYVRLLADHAVLDDAVLRPLAVSQLDAELEELEHDLLHGDLPCAVTLGLDHCLERLERGTPLADGNELCNDERGVHATGKKRGCGGSKIHGCEPSARLSAFSGFWNCARFLL
jgi:hypothetical protein